ncbi:MAG: hypothetical protein WBP40_00785 [Candidatus Moraniibacteriota bacterium]
MPTFLASLRTIKPLTWLVLAVNGLAVFYNLIWPSAYFLPFIPFFNQFFKLYLILMTPFVTPEMYFWKITGVESIGYWGVSWFSWFFAALALLVDLCILITLSKQPRDLRDLVLRKYLYFATLATVVSLAAHVAPFFLENGYILY